MLCAPELSADGKEVATEQQVPGHTARGLGEISHAGDFRTLDWRMEH